MDKQDDNETDLASLIEQMLWIDRERKLFERDPIRHLLGKKFYAKVRKNGSRSSRVIECIGLVRSVRTTVFVPPSGPEDKKSTPWHGLKLQTSVEELETLCWYALKTESTTGKWIDPHGDDCTKPGIELLQFRWL